MKKIIILLLLLLGIKLHGQDYFPDYGMLYNPDDIARIDVHLDSDFVDSLFYPGNEADDIEYMASFTFTRGNYSETIDSVGFRLRGNTSRYSRKKSFKISLNTFIPGQKFQGVEKINLNGEHNDPSLARSYIGWFLMRKAGVPGSRAGYVDLYINDEYRGLYINVEHIDEEFIDLRYNNNDGNMYKCLWPADLSYISSNPNDYKFEHEGRRAYALKRNEEIDDYSDLLEFIDALNNSDDTEFQEKVEKLFNVNVYLKYLALEVLLGHWDAYSFNKNNFYLYKNEGTAKFEFIPYDLDNTMGIDWFNVDWTSRSIYSWANDWANEARPLYTKILKNQIYRDRYSYYMNEVIGSWFNSGYMNPFCDGIRNMIKISAMNDVYRTHDYGYDYDNFYNSFDTYTGDHVKEGLKPYISSRSSNALNELILNPIDPIITLLYLNTPLPGEKCKMEFMVEDDGQIGDVKLYYTTGLNYSTAVIDRNSEGNYVAKIDAPINSEYLKFYIEASDNEANLSRDPVVGFYEVNYNINSKVEESYYSEVILYPNPTTSEIFLSAVPEISWDVFSIYDFSGRLMQFGEINGNCIAIRPSMKSGLYILKAKGLQGTVPFDVIKKFEKK